MVIIISRGYYESVLYNYGFAIGYLGRENLNTEMLAFALPKRSPLLGPFNWAIQHMHQMGLIDYFLRRSTEKKIPYRSEDAAIQEWVKVRRQSTFRWYERQRQKKESGGHLVIAHLSLSDLQSVFVLAALGFTLSLTVFAVEVYYFTFCF